MEVEFKLTEKGIIKGLSTRFGIVKDIKINDSGRTAKVIFKRNKMFETHIFTVDFLGNLIKVKGLEIV